jgi:MFS family permease
MYHSVSPLIYVSDLRYILSNYRREETGRRMSYIFSCAAFAGAVGGLIGFGLVRIETGSVLGWQWLYIVS